MAADDLPVLIVGDVHGDIERLVGALHPYPANEWWTIFLGDLVDYGMFGVGCLRYARDRQNTEVILGNHEVAMLWALRDPTRIGFFISIGAHQHDLDELGADESDPVNAINSAANLLLGEGDAHLLWEVMSGKGVFATQPERLERWLQLTDSRRVVFGHTPHRHPTPLRYDN